jgi:hypothetical protein
MARRSDLGKKEELWSEADLKEIARARAIQELVTAWKLLRKWRQ